MDPVSTARIERERYESAVLSAFGFLVDDFGYTSSPTVFGDNFRVATESRFRKGEQSIVFSKFADRSHFFDLNFSPFDLKSRQPPLPNIKYVPLWNFSIRRILEVRRAPTSLIEEGEIEEVAGSFAKAVSRYACDVIEGDYGVFGPLVYLVESSNERYPMMRNTKGVFSTVAAAEEYACMDFHALKPKEGRNFTIYARELDFKSEP